MPEKLFAPEHDNEYADADITTGCDLETTMFCRELIETVNKGAEESDTTTLAVALLQAPKNEHSSTVILSTALDVSKP